MPLASHHEKDGGSNRQRPETTPYHVGRFVVNLLTFWLKKEKRKEGWIREGEKERKRLGSGEAKAERGLSCPALAAQAQFSDSSPQDRPLFSS